MPSEACADADRMLVGPRSPWLKGDGMQNIFGVLVIAAVWALPFLLAWAVIYSAVLAALRRHDRDDLVQKRL